MKSIWIAAAVMASLAASPASAMKPVTIADQGSFMAGGTVVTAPGAYGGNTNPLNQAGQTLHGDHAYVFYQIPAQAHNTALVFLHGYGQSGKTWETTPDGRDGFQNIFLEKGYKTYIADQRGAAEPAGRRSRRLSALCLTTSCGTTISVLASGRRNLTMSRSGMMRRGGISFSGK